MGKKMRNASLLYVPSLLFSLSQQTTQKDASADQIQKNTNMLANTQRQTDKLYIPHFL